MKMGRPSGYSEAVASKICERLALGESLRMICQSDDMPGISSVIRWLANDQHEDFRAQYARAREAQADALFDEILEIADDGSNDWMARKDPDDPKNLGWRENGEAIRRSQLRVDARKWMAGKLRPKKYGERQEIEVTNKTVSDKPLSAEEWMVAHGKGG